MLYFKHSELVKKYHISLKTVHNWIDAAKQGKLDLELHKNGNRTYIANKPKNLVVLDQLVKGGKKYRNSRFHKEATPIPHFYDLYNRRQIVDIISNLKIHNEIPRQYNYMDGGATNWDKYTKRQWREEGSSLLTSTIELLRANFDAIDMLIAKSKRVNVIDIGPGNALPVKELLDHLIKKGALHRYIAIDISESMLDIAENNLKNWFGDSIRYEGYVRDITYERFDDLLVDDRLDSQADDTINIALFLGATPMNFPSPQDSLRVIQGSLAHNDLLIYSDKPDSEIERRYFDFSHGPETKSLSPNHRFIFDLLNIDESLYDVEMGYDEQRRMRYIRVRLKVALTIKIKLESGERKIIFEKGDTILLWRVWHMTALEIIAEFENVGFELLQSNLTQDRQYLLAIYGVNSRSTRAS